MDYKSLNKYIDDNKSPVDDLLLKLHRETHLKTLAPQMSSGPTQGRLLEIISKLINPNLILEIGTFTGYATICLAKGLTKVGKIITIDVNAEVGTIAKKYFAQCDNSSQIVQLFGDAKDIVPALECHIDLCFIDADKESYMTYYELILPMMRQGGIILADNILWYGKVWENDDDRRTQLLRKFNEFVANDPRVENIILPLRDGINVIRKK